MTNRFLFICILLLTLLGCIKKITINLLGQQAEFIRFMVCHTVRKAAALRYMG